MYKALIFDLGKVVFDVSFDRVFSAWAESVGSTFEEVKAGFEFNHLFDDFEKDAITPPEFRRGVRKMAALELSDEDFDKGWCALYMDVFPQAEQLLRELKQSYRLVALTNTNIIHQPVWTEKYKDILTYFEKVFISNEMKVRKPEKEIYRQVLDYLGAKPEEAVFLDDNPDNTRGAEALGIKTILVTSPQQMQTELYYLLQA